MGTVEILPLGWEHDRAVLGVVRGQTNRVHVLSRDDKPLNRHFIRKVQRTLTKSCLCSDVKIWRIPVEREFDYVLMQTSHLIRSEADAGHLVRLNMSSGSKIAGAAATIAGMYHRGRLERLYYARPRKYLNGGERRRPFEFRQFGLTKGLDATVLLPEFTITPHPLVVERILAILFQDGPQTYLELIAKLARLHISPFDDFKAADGRDHAKYVQWTLRLRRKALYQMSSSALIEIGPGSARKKRVSLSKNGKFHALITGFVERLPESEGVPLVTVLPSTI